MGKPTGGQLVGFFTFQMVEPKQFYK